MPPDYGQVAMDFVAGWGDTLSLGGTKIAREKVGHALGIGDANDVVNYRSGAYFAGELVGEVHLTYLGGAGASSALRRGLQRGKNWRKTMGGMRLETGNVHLFPGLTNRSWNKVNALHFHLDGVPALRLVHFPYQMWPVIQTAQLIRWTASEVLTE
jgi:hypothetical protein